MLSTVPGPEVYVPGVGMFKVHEGRTKPVQQWDRRVLDGKSSRRRRYATSRLVAKAIIPDSQFCILLNEDMIAGTPVAELFELVEKDEWRNNNPFSPEIASCQEKLFDPKLSRGEKAEALNLWMGSKAYPCLFGRMAAKRGATSILILEERDLWRSDQEIEDFLRVARLQWKREALGGTKHAFVFVAVSRHLAHARPDKELCRLTVRLSELFLRQRIEPNLVFRDELQLQIPSSPSKNISWRGGVDSFLASGDGRWWHDHRIPGGIGFVVNSVGHMARTLIEEAAAKSRSLRDKVDQLSEEKLTQWALPLAMRTILTAQEKSKIPGTRLAPREQDLPVSLPSDLSSYSCEFYHGWYDTDETIRGEFFNESPERPSSISTERKLDFTYLHKRDEEDYKCMSLGLEILEALGVKDDSDTK